MTWDLCSVIKLCFQLFCVGWLCSLRSNENGMINILGIVLPGCRPVPGLAASEQLKLSQDLIVLDTAQPGGGGGKAPIQRHGNFKIFIWFFKRKQISISRYNYTLLYLNQSWTDQLSIPDGMTETNVTRKWNCCKCFVKMIGETRARILIEPWDDFYFLDIQKQSQCEINILLMPENAENLQCCYKWQRNILMIFLCKLNLLFRYFFSDKYYLSSCKCVVLNAVQTCHKTSCTEAKNHSKNETE